MSQQIQNQLAEFISTLNSGADFAAQELPEALTQLLTFKTIQCSLGIALGLALAVGTAIFFCRFLDGFSDDGRKHPWATDRFGLNGFGFTAFVGSALSVIISLLLICINTYNLLLILLAPKVYLLEYAQGFFSK